MRQRFKALLGTLILFISLPATASSPLSPEQCQGSAMPYIAPDRVVAHPDSLTPVMINHVGRHGARYLSSASQVNKVLDFLNEAEKSGVLTPLGEELRDLCNRVTALSIGHWGALDSLGMSEQEGIARRLCQAYPQLVKNSTVEAISSYVPRCIMSMDCFTHEMARCDNTITVYTSSGRINSPLMRPFDLDSTYIGYVRREPYKDAYKRYFDQLVSTAPAIRLTTAPLSDKKLRDGSFAAYRMLSGLQAMGLEVDLTRYFTIDELNSLWAVHNLDLYLVRTANC